MPRRNCFLTAQFAPRWQRVAFLLATLLVSLCFTSIGLTTFSVWGIWFTAVLLWSRVGQSGTAVVANVNLVMNVATALFTYTMLTLIGCLLFRSRAIGIFCGLSLVIVFHAAPVFNLSEIAPLITPKLAVNAMWPISVVKQFLMMIFVTGLMVLTLRRIRLPVEV